MKHQQDDLIASPCVSQCALTEMRVCAGCGRHIDEIVGWSAASNDRRRAWSEAARQRLAITAAAGTISQS